MQRVEICQTNPNRIQPNQTARATKTQSQSQGLKQGKQKSKKGTRVLYRQIRKKKEKKKKGRKNQIRADRARTLLQKWGTRTRCVTLRLRYAG
jgi:hypothetical protein